MTAVEMPERHLAAANDHGERSGEGLLVALVFPAAFGGKGALAVWMTRGGPG
jgi:hypothetical protein